MAADIKTSMDSDEAEPMRAEVFEIAVGALNFHGARQETPRIVQAARAVLVDGIRPGEAATRYQFPPERISEAVGRIRDKWAAICAEQGLVTETFSLSAPMIELLRQIELEALQPLRAETEGGRRKKAATAKATLVKSAATNTAVKKAAAGKAAPKVAEKKPAKYKKPVPKK